MVIGISLSENGIIVAILGNLKTMVFYIKDIRSRLSAEGKQEAILYCQTKGNGNIPYFFFFPRWPVFIAFHLYIYTCCRLLSYEFYAASVRNPEAFLARCVKDCSNEIVPMGFAQYL